jgi:Ca-activated chloride channel family protein
VSFASPWLLLFLLLVPVAIGGYFLLERHRAQRAERWSTGALMPNMVPSRPGWRRYVPLAFFLVALVLLLAGFARPQATIDVPREGATVVLALDISGSMDAKDVPAADGKGRTTRLLAARQAASDFLDKLPDKYRVALVTFGNRGTVRVPPTYDHAKVLQAIPQKALLQGTALGSGIESTITVAQRAFGKPEPGEPPNPVAVLLLSDGGNSGTEDPAQAVAKARKIGLPISTVALGTEGRFAEVKQKLGGSTDAERVVQVPVAPDTLKEVARGTEGTFFQAHTGNELKQVYEDLNSQLVHDKKKREITVAVAGAAIVFLLVGALLSGLWFRRIV